MAATVALFVGMSYYARQQAMRSSMVSSSAALAVARADMAAATRDAPSFAPKEYSKVRGGPGRAWVCQMRRAMCARPMPQGCSTCAAAAGAGVLEGRGHRVGRHSSARAGGHQACNVH